MKAAVVGEKGLEIRDVPQPRPKPNEVLVRVRAAGLNRADLSVDTTDPEWPDRVLAATDGQGVHLIVDQVSGPVANQNLKATRVLGRIVNVGRLGGSKGEFDFDLHAARRIDYI